MTIDEIQKLCDEATPGPWAWNSHYSDRMLVSLAPGITEDLILGGAFRELGMVQSNKEFIAEARTHLPKLLAVARLMKTALDSDFFAGPSGWERTCKEALAALEAPSAP